MSAIQQFLTSGTTGGKLLIVASILAMAWANSPWGEAYHHLLEVTLGIDLGPFRLEHSLHHWINDGLMALFFLLVGLEIKREILAGELASVRQATLPVAAAIGGMAAPAAIYVAIASGDPTALRGWAIPAATDIAFALAALSVLGSRVPSSLKVFLTALAIIDDLGAIVIIAVFYSTDLSFAALGLAAAAIVVLVGFNRLGVKRLWPYLLVGVFLWLFVLKSGVHATLAGVVLALTIPLGRSSTSREAEPPLLRLEHGLQPIVSVLVLPLFGLANAGLSLAGIGIEAVGDPVPLGIALGLVLGKPLGVMAASALVIGLKLARMPAQAGYSHLLGVAFLCGIGFTMSLFIAGLAFSDPRLVDESKLGILAGSLASTVLGLAWLARTRPKAA
jgi:NhaA family Na+:H+ antiporter